MIDRRLLTRFSRLIVLAFCAIGCAASAAPLVYNESINGDLPSTGPLTTLMLGIGANTVSGNAAFIPEVRIDFDSFGFSVPFGTELTAVEVELVDTAGNIFTSSWEFVFSGSATAANETFLTTLLADSPGTATYVGGPLGEGLYYLRHRQMSLFLPQGGAFDYVFTLRVQAVSEVPEPSSLMLFGLTALALALAAAGRRSL